MSQNYELELEQDFFDREGNTVRKKPLKPFNLGFHFPGLGNRLKNKELGVIKRGRRFRSSGQNLKKAGDCVPLTEIHEAVHYDPFYWLWPRV